MVIQNVNLTEENKILNEQINRMKFKIKHQKDKNNKLLKDMQAVIDQNKDQTKGDK